MFVTQSATVLSAACSLCTLYTQVTQPVTQGHTVHSARLILNVFLSHFMFPVLPAHFRVLMVFYRILQFSGFL
jgi:hypothetical protein